MSTSSDPRPAAVSPSEEVVEICRRLIRIDTSNYGDGSGPGERAAAEYVCELLTEVGWDPELIESEPGRASVVLRIEGTDRSRPALVLHGHTDVVPAQAEDWQVDPFAAEVRDGMIWGRGAVDMKDMDAMILAVVRDMARTGWRPERDVVVAFFADEEAGGAKGARWLVENRPELFEGATEAISEVGGYSVEIDGRRVYLLQTAEKGLAWLRLLAEGTAGHGSQVNTDNAVTRLAGAVARIGAHSWPLHLTGTVRQLLSGVAELTGTTFDPADPEGIDRLVRALGPAQKFVGATLRTGANPTQLTAGYKAAEKGLAWLRLLAEGTAGHGSQVNTDNAVTRLAGAVARIGAHSWPLHLTGTVRQLLSGVAELTGTTFDPADPEGIDRLVRALGPAQKFVGATLRTGANPTQLTAGYKANVIPGSAEAALDVRYLPGEEESVSATLTDLAGPGVRIEPIHADIALEVPFEGALVDHMIAAIDAEDPGATVLPYMLSGGTDNKSLARLGITGYGFAPLQLPPDLDFAGMFHGVDERVPVDALRFGVRVLDRLLRTA